MNFYSQDDAAVEIGSGLSNQKLGFRLAYEVRREFAPYIGVSFNKYYGNTASYVVGGGGEASSTEYTIGIHAWF
jgi:copper resistance protein B